MVLSETHVLNRVAIWTAVRHGKYGISVGGTVYDNQKLNVKVAALTVVLSLHSEILSYRREVQWHET